jgi:hypothetical protein
VSGHTGGVWSWKGNGLYSDNGRIVLYAYATVTCGRSDDDYYSCRPPSPSVVIKVSDADKAVLAAAPDLLAALQLLLRETELSGNTDAKDYGCPNAIAASRAAIAKATGA